jgi:hypothetical protein
MKVIKENEQKMNEPPWGPDIQFWVNSAFFVLSNMV